MNTTTNKQDEILEEAIYQFYPERLDDYVTDAERNAFANGANWQKEQDKVIIDKLKFSLTKIVNWHKVHESLSFIDEKDLKESEQLLQSLK